MQSVSFQPKTETEGICASRCDSLVNSIESLGTKAKAIAVTSLHTTNSKTYISYEVARVLAGRGYRVLWMDVDIDQNRIHKKQDGEYKAISLFTYLERELDLSEIIIETKDKNLSQIIRGKLPKNTIELLSSQRFKAMIAILKEEFDYVVIDTPALGVSIDSVVVGNESDGTILVLDRLLGNDKNEKMALKSLKMYHSKMLAMVIYNENSNVLKVL